MSEETQEGNGKGKLRTLAEAVWERWMLARRAGLTFGGLRDLYLTLGYKPQLSIEDYRARYYRGGLAARVVDVMPDATWRGDMELIEDENPDVSTAFEKAWDYLDTKHQIKSKLKRVDKLAGLSNYAVLLIGATGSPETELPRATGPDSLLYLRPVIGGGGPGSQGRGSRAVAAGADATVAEYETDASNPRFGQPKTYNLKITDVNSAEFQRPVHHSRIMHIAEDLLDDEVFGLPSLERVWNLFDDLEKVTGGGAEAFWIRANQGMHLNLDKDMELSDADGAIAKLKDDAEKYQHQQTRWLRTRGVDVKMLGSDVANFSNPADAIITQIAGARKIPKRILVGSEQGELASSQDRENFRDQVNGRQTSYAGPYIVRPLVDRLIEFGYLPTPEAGVRGYEVVWPHTQVMTEQEKVEGAKGWAGVNQAYGGTVFTNSEIRDKWAGREPLSDEQKTEVEEEKAANMPPALAAVDDEEENPFARAAADKDMVRVLAKAIEAGNVDVVEAIVGVKRA